MEIAEKIRAVQDQMVRRGFRAYIVPSADYHASEYVGDHFKCREYLTGFTGSAGTLVILTDQAYLWTDGRYFIQAEEQLAGTPVCLMKSGRPGVPEITGFLADRLEEHAVVAFDGRTVSKSFVQDMAEKMGDKQIRFDGGADLVSSIWRDRPQMPMAPVWELGIEYAGLSREEKLQKLRQEMNKKHADLYLGVALDEIAWLLNLRGDDIPYTPVFLAYLLVSQDTAVLFVHRQSVPDEIAQKLSGAGVGLAPYESVAEHLRRILPGKKILYDPAVVSYDLYQSLPEGVERIEESSPLSLIRAAKTPQETAHIRAAHIRDGAAVCRFICWLKKNVSRGDITELSASAKLLGFRSQMEGFLGQSFAPIVGYGAHGAVIHYKAVPESDAVLKPEGFCLVDTGGHYLEGTTDITRTIALGPLTEEERRVYTLVLRGNLNLGAARFLKGTCGANLDYLARGPLWEQGLDYAHGTGHGVGYLLSVHEGPQRIHWRLTGPNRRQVPFEAGMVVSDEPGVYLEGRFGVRLENLLLCCEDRKNEYGQFMHFDCLTMVPFDREAVDVSLLLPHERERLNEYHQMVYENISPYLEGEELEWLRGATASL